jgi:hypothetical protein
MEEWMKIISVPSYLLAAYQTEFDEVEANVMVVLMETARLFIQVRGGNTRTRLPELTEMQLLYLFKGLVVENLGYHFFNRSFDLLAARIDESLEEAEIKAYALFFLSCAAIECDNEAGFRFLIQKVGTNALPLPISLAARCELESSTNAHKSGLLKFHKDKLRKLLTTSGKAQAAQRVAVQAKIDELFEKPLTNRRLASQS